MKHGDISDFGWEWPSLLQILWRWIVNLCHGHGMWHGMFLRYRSCGEIPSASRTVEWTCRLSDRWCCVCSWAKNLLIWWCWWVTEALKQLGRYWFGEPLKNPLVWHVHPSVDWSWFQLEPLLRMQLTKFAALDETSWILQWMNGEVPTWRVSVYRMFLLYLYHFLSTFQFLLCLSGCRGSVLRPLHGAQEQCQPRLNWRLELITI